VIDYDVCRIVEFSTIVYCVDAGVATITLNRPDVLNSFTSKMRAELRDAFDQVAGDSSARAIVLTGAGRAFSAGQDLRERSAAYQSGSAPVLGETLRQEYNPLILAMRNLPKPIVGAVKGIAAGAGCSLALACDLRIASDSASFLQAFTKIGLVPDSGSSFFLPRLIGPARAAEMVFLAEPVSANDALAMGLINRVVPASQLLAAALALAARLAQLPTAAIGQAKRQLNQALTAPLEQVLEAEAEGQAFASQTHDHFEGVDAFLQKRSPEFTGD